jgi:FtsP/CotA-like multicopper oxidase with cupredoxin domain
LIVEGIENVNPAVAGLPQRVLIVREEPSLPPPPDDESSTDLSVNYVVIAAPAFVPARINMKPGEKQFWRVVNAAAHTILDLQLLYDGVNQPLEVIALDSVPIGSQDGTGKGKSLTLKHILIPTAGRAEFIVTGPGSTVADARLLTAAVNTGPDGDVDPTRTLFTIETSAAGAGAADLIITPKSLGPPPAERFAGLAEAKVDRTRRLYFSEDGTYFYITVAGQTPKPYSMDDPPSIVTTQGSVEDWTIENRAQENHEFHMHQIHFLLLERNGKTVRPDEQAYLDTVNIPYWDGVSPYPSVTLRMDFRGPDVGDFVYHCHILDHEDAGMMAIIRVLSRTNNASTTAAKPAGLEKRTLAAQRH